MSTAGIAHDDAVIHTRLQRHAVEQVGVALTDSRALDQRGVCAVLEGIRVVIQIIIVIDDIGTDVVIDHLDLLIVGKVIEIVNLVPRRKQLVDLITDFILLLKGSVVGDRILKGCRRNTVVTDLTICLTVMANDIVTLRRNTGMLKSTVQDGSPIVRQALITDVGMVLYNDRNFGHAVLHLLTQIVRRLVQTVHCGLRHCHTIGRRLGELHAKTLILGVYVGHGNRKIRLRDHLGICRVLSQSRHRQQRDDQKNTDHTAPQLLSAHNHAS